MNPLKTLFNKVFDLAPPSSGPDSKEDAEFEWNPEDETVAPTSAPATSWKRGNTDDGATKLTADATHGDIAASAHSLPTPMFEKKAASGRPVNDAPPLPIAVSATPVPSARPVWNEQTGPVPSAEPDTHILKAPTTPTSSAGAAVAPSSPQHLIPLSDFEDVYRKAGIKSPPHGYGVERVYRLLTSRRLVGLDRTVRRSALLTALDAAGVPPSDVSQDAVLRRKALTAYEAEKALELQSLRSRNESRAEALQDTVETFTRQKQTQIERLAQGTTSAVRAQSDLEIRKRMEQDRLYRSLAYFVEPLPSPVPPPAPAVAAKIAGPEGSRIPPRLDATIDMLPPPREEKSASTRVVDVTVSSPDPKQTGTPPNAVLIPEDSGDTRPISQSGLEMALRAAAEDRTAEGSDRQAKTNGPGAVKKPGSQS